MFFVNILPPCIQEIQLNKFNSNVELCVKLILMWNCVILLMQLDLKLLFNFLLLYLNVVVPCFYIVMKLPKLVLSAYLFRDKYGVTIFLLFAYRE